MSYDPLDPREPYPDDPEPDDMEDLIACACGVTLYPDDNGDYTQELAADLSLVPHKCGGGNIDV